MRKYIFIFGNWPKLSLAELQAILPKIEKFGLFFALAAANDSPEKLINQLGGTIKIGRFLEKIPQIGQLKKKQWLGWILSKDKLDEKQKINFSFSLYGGSSQDYKQLDALA
ncbi:MAG: hypothetical protein PHO91_02740, partial [Patescibacteria group bacterium]|nr:hypothetical protein [Patescibacteria group bacterium]